MKKRNLILAILCVSFLVLGMVSGASALTITPSSPTLDAFGDENNDPAVLAAIATYLEGASFLYKSDVVKDALGGLGTDSGSLSGSYNTVFDLTPNDPSKATITWVGPSYIEPIQHLLVKDGKQEPAWYLFELSNWDGKEALVLTDFWPSNGAISHVSLYGKTTSTSVPEPTTLLLLGLGLVGMAGIRRKLR